MSNPAPTRPGTAGSDPTPAPNPRGRATDGPAWHHHGDAITHVHEAGDRPHSHLLATDTDTRERLRRLLRHAARGPLTSEYRAEAAALLDLIP